MTTIRTVSTQDLTTLNNNAITKGYNRAVTDEAIAKLDPNGTHVVAYAFIHNGDHYRVHFYTKFLGKEEPVGLWIDVSFDDYDQYVKTLNVTV